MLQATREQHEYHLTIVHVRMQVYFPSRMKIEHSGSQLTSEAAPLEDGQFIFNQEVVLKDGKEECLELVAHLLTDKGSMYIAGVVRLYPQQMILSQGKTATLPLEKCIDSSASCELKVTKVVTIQSQTKTPSYYKAKLNQYVVLPKREDLEDLQFTPTRKKLSINNQQCQSSYQLRLNVNTPSPLHASGKNIFRRGDNQQRRRRLQTSQDKQDTQIFNWKNPPSVDTERERQLQSQIYKEGYEKLKQKYRRQVEKSKQQLAKRLAVEKNENNLKLVAVRMTLKMENLQRQLNQKSSRLREYQALNNSFTLKEQEASSLREQLSKREQETNKLQQIVNELTTENAELKSKCELRNSQELAMIQSLQTEIQNLQKQLTEKDKQIQTQSFAFDECLTDKEQEIQSLKLHDQHHQETIELLQQSSSDLQKQLASERASSKLLLNEQALTIAAQSKQLQKLKQERRQWSDIQEQLTARLSSLESERQLSSQEYEATKTELDELRSVRAQFSRLTVEHSSAKSIVQEAESELTAVIEAHKTTIRQITNKHQQQIDHYQKINRQIDNRVKALSSKVHQLQRQLQSNRSQHDKSKKNLEAAERQIDQLKQRQKSARQALKEKCNATLGIQTEYFTLKQKLKNIDQIYNLQADKLRVEEENLREQLSREVNKGHELATKNNQLTATVSQLQAQLQSAEGRCKTEESNSSDKQVYIQNVIRQYEQQILTLENEIYTLKQQQSRLTVRLNSHETEARRREEKIQKCRKDTRIAEQLYDTLQQNYKTKTSDYDNLINQHEDASLKLQSYQKQLAQLRRENSDMTSDNKVINQKLLSLQQDLARVTEDCNLMSEQLSLKEKDIQMFQQTLRKEKEAFVKVETLFASFKRETEKYRERLSENIQNILQTSANYAALYQLTDIQHSNTHNYKNQATLPQIVHQLETLGKQFKLIIAKQIENIKRIQLQNSDLQSQLNKRTQSEKALLQQIQELSMEFQSKIEEKDAELANFTNIVEQLNQSIQQKQDLQQQLNVRIQELAFTVSSMKLDSEALANQNTKKLAHQRKLNEDLTEKTEYQQLIIQQLDKRCNSLQVTTEQLQILIETKRQTIEKTEKTLSEIIESKKMEEQRVKDLKKQRKELSEDLAKVELHLSTELELSKSIKQQLRNEEGKTKGLNQFITNLMRQKQAAISSEIEKSETIFSLESQLMESQKDVEQFKEQIQRISKNYESQKDLKKKNGGEFKRIQQQLLQQKINNSKLQQKLKQRLISAAERQEETKKTSLKNQRIIQKQKSEIQRLQEELQSKEATLLQTKREYDETRRRLNSEIQKKNAALSKLSVQINDAEESLFIQKETSSNLREQLDATKKEMENLQLTISEMEKSQNDLNNEIKQKQQKLFQITAKIYKLQNMVEANQGSQNNILQNLEAQYMQKYEVMCDEYERKVDELNRAIAQQHRSVEEKQKQISKLASQLKASESQQGRTRKYLQQKIKKVEEEKLAMLSLKNQQIQKHINDSRNNDQRLKLQEFETKRLVNELQIGHRTINALNQAAHLQNEKNRGVNRAYQAEIDQSKKKEQANKTFREDVKNYQWNTQREIRKVLQNFTRNFLQIKDNKTQKAIQMVRGIQTSILSVLLQKISQK